MAVRAKAKINTYINYIETEIRPVRHVKVVPKVMFVADMRAGRDCSFFRKNRPNQLIYLVNSTL